MRIYIFACIHNAGRSQISAALFNNIADRTLAHAISAGTQPAAQVHPVVQQVMQEIGIDLSQSRPQKLTAVLARDAEMLITMGCGDECPYIPGLRRADWPLRDPKGQPIEEVRKLREEIREYVERLVRQEHCAKTTPEL
jgi:protein-tyrosine-phosphatase